MANPKSIWLDGRFVPFGTARIHVLSHALHYGSGVFEGIRVYETPDGPAAFRLKDHVNRLFHSAAAFEIKIPYSRETVRRAVLTLVAKNKYKECYVRPIVFYGEGKMQLDPVGASVRVAIAAWPWGKYLGDHPALNVGIAKYLRFHPDSIAPGAKISGFYATSVLARLEARKRGLNECVMLDHEGYVAEGPGENIFIVKRGRLIVPESPSILPGFTRDSVITIAHDLHLPTVMKRVKRAELLDADEVFFAGTAVEIGAVGKIEGRRIGTGTAGSITTKIRDRYFAATHGHVAKYKKWLAYVRQTF